MSVLLNKVTEVVVTGIGGVDGGLRFVVALRFEDMTERITATFESIDVAHVAAEFLADAHYVETHTAPPCITRKSAVDYLDNDANTCPYCKSANIEGSYIDPESMEQVLQCELCRRTWRNIFALVGVGDNDSEYFKDGYDETLSNNDAE